MYILINIWKQKLRKRIRVLYFMMRQNLIKTPVERLLSFSLIFLPCCEFLPWGHWCHDEVLHLTTLYANTVKIDCNNVWKSACLLQVLVYDEQMFWTSTCLKLLFVSHVLFNMHTNKQHVCWYCCSFFVKLLLTYLSTAVVFMWN